MFSHNSLMEERGNSPHSGHPKNGWLVNYIIIHPLYIRFISHVYPFISHLDPTCIPYVYCNIIIIHFWQRTLVYFYIRPDNASVSFPVISVPLRSANVTGVGPRKHIYNVVPWCPLSYMLDSAGLFITPLTSI